MSFWQIFGRSAVSDQGETIQRLGGSTSVSSKGTISTTLALQLWDLMGQFSPKRALSAATAVLRWAALQLD